MGAMHALLCTVFILTDDIVQGVIRELRPMCYYCYYSVITSTEEDCDGLCLLLLG